VATEEEIGYQDGIRHVLRVLRRRLKALEESLEEATDAAVADRLKARMDEVRHLLDVIESLHR
jgi:hypothetical protein